MKHNLSFTFLAAIILTGVVLALTSPAQAFKAQRAALADSAPAVSVTR